MNYSFIKPENINSAARDLIPEVITDNQNFFSQYDEIVKKIKKYLNEELTSNKLVNYTLEKVYSQISQASLPNYLLVPFINNSEFLIKQFVYFNTINQILTNNLLVNMNFFNKYRLLKNTARGQEDNLIKTEKEPPHDRICRSFLKNKTRKNGPFLKDFFMLKSEPTKLNELLSGNYLYKYICDIYKTRAQTGKYTWKERIKKITHFKIKKIKRIFTRFIPQKYIGRSKVACKKLRLKGRFVKNGTVVLKKKVLFKIQV